MSLATVEADVPVLHFTSFRAHWPVGAACYSGCIAGVREWTGENASPSNTSNRLSAGANLS